jgi:hypothetical protein
MHEEGVAVTDRHFLACRRSKQRTPRKLSPDSACCRIVAMRAPSGVFLDFLQQFLSERP